MALSIIVQRSKQQTTEDKQDEMTTPTLHESDLLRLFAGLKDKRDSVMLPVISSQR
jgi:hypothetical protein